MKRKTCQPLRMSLPDIHAGAIDVTSGWVCGPRIPLITSLPDMTAGPWHFRFPANKVNLESESTRPQNV